MVVGFVRCAGCDVEVRRADAILHRTPTGSRFFCATCPFVGPGASPGRSGVVHGEDAHPVGWAP